mgnify:FL=1
MSFNYETIMTKYLESKFLLTIIVGFCLVGFQSTSVAVTSEFNDDAVVITVDSTNLKFSPNEVTINEGQTIRFFWSGEFLDHNAVAVNGIFNSGEPEKEVDYSFTFDKGTNDTYNFICEPHELLEMVGTITVNPYDESNSTGSNSTSSVGSEQDDVSSSSSLSGFLFIPALVLIILVSRRLR